MTAITSTTGGSDQQWQLLQQLRASRAAETAASTGSLGAASTTATDATSATPAMSQSGTGATTTASAPSGIFDAVATKLMSGMQSFLVNMQSDTSTGGSAASGASASVSGYGNQATTSTNSSLTNGLSV